MARYCVEYGQPRAEVEEMQADDAMHFLSAVALYGWPSDRIARALGGSVGGVSRPSVKPVDMLDSYLFDKAG